MCTNVTLVTPEDVEDDSYVDVEGLEVEISEEISTPDRTEDNIPVEKEVSTDDACLEQNQTKLTPERETEIERNNPYHVSQRTPLRGDNVSDSQNQQKEKTKSKQSKKSHSQLDTENTPSVFDLSNWRNSVFYVTELEGHNDLITSSDIQGTMLVTASRDTTVKVWDMKEMREVRSLGGHTGGVNAVVLIPTSSSNNICKKAGFPSTKGQLILSGSSDCSFKLWCSATGEVRRSTYTFSPVTCVGYHNSASVIITGSDGGKLETWDVQSSKSLQSLRAFADSVSGIQIHETHVFVSSLDGIIKVYEVNSQQLQCVFESEGTRSTDGSALCCRGIRGMTISNGLVYYGDDGPNVKALNWKSVRSAEGEKYLCSLDDGETDRIMSICSSKLSDSWVIISAGVQLKVWNQTSNARYIRPDARRVKPSYYLGLTKSPRHSDVESDLESSESESELKSDDLIDDEPGAPSPSWKSWCVVV
uniref:F-box/WD repeat-containing protein 7 n=1 Tax=Magallana gigas TaxID=29159 RepID=A0A8W8MIA8_MAGGI